MRKFKARENKTLFLEQLLKVINNLFLEPITCRIMPSSSYLENSGIRLKKLPFLDFGSAIL